MTTELKPFHLAASYTIGSHILPGTPIDNIRKTVEGKLKLTILPCNEIIEGINKGIFDLGLIESPLYNRNLIYKEWMEDEMVVCSKKPLPHSLNEELLSNCNLVCRTEGSLTRNFITEALKKLGLSYQTFNSLREVDNATAIIQSIKWAKPNIDHPTIAIVSQLAIEDELKYSALYQSRICNQPIIRKFHLIYSKEKQNDHLLNEIIDQLMKHII